MFKASTLIEVMVSTTIILIVFLLVLGYFASNKESYNRNETLTMLSILKDHASQVKEKKQWVNKQDSNEVYKIDQTVNYYMGNNKLLLLHINIYRINSLKTLTHREIICIED
jgi:hypothetical protein